MFLDEEYEYFDEDILESTTKNVSVTKFLELYFDSEAFKARQLKDEDFALWIDTRKIPKDDWYRYTELLGNFLSQLKSGGKLVLDFVNPYITKDTRNKIISISFYFARLEEDIMIIDISESEINREYEVYSYINDMSNPVLITFDPSDLVTWINSSWSDEESTADNGEEIVATIEAERDF